MSRDPSQRSFIAYLEDRPGVLARVVSLFRRRAYNIESLLVGRSERPGVSRLTIVVRADDDTARRLEANLYKLVNVLYVEEVSRAPSVDREWLIVKVATGPDRRTELLQLCEAFGARIVDVSSTSLIFEMTGPTDKVDGLLETVRPFGVVEMVRTGMIAMTRGESAHQGLHFSQAAPSENERAA
jgi:acetolactate synthase-1/3 small subunit